MRREAFVQVLAHLREPILLVDRDGMIVAGNVAAAKALGTSVTALEGTSLEELCVEPTDLPNSMRIAVQGEAAFPLRARDGRRYSCDASLLGPELFVLRLTGGPDASKRARAFFEMFSRLDRVGGAPGHGRTVDEIARTLLTFAMSTMGAQAGGLFLLEGHVDRLELTSSIGYRPESVEQYRSISMQARIPITDAIRAKSAVYLGSVEEYHALYAVLLAEHPELVKTAMACVPLELDGRCIGGLALGFRMPWDFSDVDRSFLHDFASQCATAIVRARRKDAADESLFPEHAASRFERLHAFTGALAQAITPAEVAEAALDASMAATGARSGGLWLLEPDATMVTLVRSVGPTGPRPEHHIDVPLDRSSRLPILDSIRTGTAVWIESCADLAARYPELARAYSSGGGESSLACVPLFSQGRCIGGLAHNFDRAHRFVEHERAFFQVLTWYAAQALERSRLYASEKLAREAAEASHRRMAFLAASDSVLSSLDYQETLAAIAKIAVPRIADWCIVEIEEDRLRGQPAVGAHVDPTKVPFVLALSRKFRERGESGHGIPAVIQTGKSQLYPSLTLDELRALADRELSELYVQSRVVSSMIVPVTARGHTLGAILLNSADPARKYDELDLAMAEELGRRVGLAIENARLYRDAREADRLKDEFLAMLSHELRNPLVPIVAAVDLMGLQDDRLYTQERGLIRRNVRHLVRLVDDLLDVSRITRGKIQLRKEVYEVSELVGDALELAAPMIEERVQRLALAVPERGIRVLADRIRISQAIANLLTNAAKYTDRGGTIVVTVRSEGDEAMISVVDSGIGIAQEVLPRIFDLFVQAAGAIDRAQGGLGIGLTVVKRLVELHGGTAVARSPGLGYGSEFVLRLPLAEAVELPIAAPAVAPAHPASGKRVLVVDDNHDAAGVLGELMNAVGFTTHIAHNGMAALAAAVEFKPDLALLDLGLPNMDGYELAKRLRTLYRSLRIVAVTGYAAETDRARSHEAGFDEHIVKPVDLEALRKIVDNMHAATR